MIGNALDVAAFAFEFSWDAAHLELVDVLLGDFLSYDGRTTLPLGPLSVPGSATFAGYSHVAGLLATLTFRPWLKWRSK